MKKFIVIILISIFLLNACTTGSAATLSATSKVQSTAVTKSTTATPAAAAAATKTVTVKATSAPKSTESQNVDTSSNNLASIALKGSLITVEGSGVQVNGGTATITTAGTYTITGTLTNGQIAVDASDDDDVKLILSGVNISNASTSAINIINADKTVIELADGTQNVVSDGASYTFIDSSVDEPNAAIFSKDDLTITGTGSLIVTGKYNDGIASKDDLNIKSGTISVSAADDGIRGKNSIEIKGGTITIKAQGDGLKSDNAEEAEEGFINIEAGVLNITAGGNAIQAETSVTILDGTLTLMSGGGAGTKMNADTSAKGISAVVAVAIEGGTFNINSSDDAINSNGSVVINNGTFNITTGDDGVHANATLEINNGEFNIAKSYEGIESAVITVNGGNFRIISSDDGINVAGGKDASGTTPGGRPGMPQDRFSTSGNYFLYINGGTFYVEAVGDGVDVNGAITMKGGLLVVNGPTSSGNGALDHDRGFSMTGGWFVAAGSSGMAQTSDTSSSQNSILVNLSSAQKAGTLFSIQDSKGETILAFTPTKQYQSVAFSSPALVKGTTYDISLGGKSTGTVTNGVYEGGAVTGATKYASFTVSSVVTMVGTASRMR